MIDFDEILKHSLADINKGFEAALSDLDRTVEAISASIQKNTGLDFALQLLAVADTTKGSVYRVYFDLDPKDEDADSITIGHYKIGSKGYPILRGAYRKSIDEFSAQRSFKDEGELEAHFVEMLNDPDSALIQAIGFGMRKLVPSENQT